MPGVVDDPGTDALEDGSTHEDSLDGGSRYPDDKPMLDSDASDTVEDDAGTYDAGESDATDADTIDAGVFDSAMLDAGAGDAGEDVRSDDDQDGGEEGVDAGEAPDAGGMESTPADGGFVPAPAGGEECSHEDENRDGQNNEGLDCTFLVSSAESLWRLDPFTGDIHHVVDVELPGDETVLDVELDIDGSILVTGGRSLYRVEMSGAVSTLISGALPFNPKGLAVSSDGSVFISNIDNLVGSRVVAASSSASVPDFFERLDPWNGAGDCVALGDTLLITSSGNATDTLVSMRFISGEVEQIGDTGFIDVVGLSFAFGHLYGMTNLGDVLEINPTTGGAVILHANTGVVFSGAASKR